MKKYIIKLLSLIVCISCALSLFSIAAFAIDPIDTGRDVSVTVTFKYADTLVPDAEFSIYRVADTDEWANFTLCGDFKGFSGRINGLETASEWDSSAKELAQYVEDNGILSLHTAITDANGEVFFSGSMKPGLYLITSTDTLFNDRIYSALPFLIILPTPDENTDEWTYDNVKVFVKGGHVFDVPSINPPPPPPPIIPQTGMLWWPVPVLLIIGLVFVIIGIVRRRSSGDEA